jgi:hypothetical protein
MQHGVKNKSVVRARANGGLIKCHGMWNLFSESKVSLIAGSMKDFFCTARKLLLSYFMHQLFDNVGRTVALTVFSFQTTIHLTNQFIQNGNNQWQ